MSDRTIAKLWEVIGCLRYGPATQTLNTKCELELRRIVTDLEHAKLQKAKQHLTATMNVALAQNTPVPDLPPYEEPPRPSCNLENPEHCEACE